MPTQESHCGLLTLPEELVVQHILARLDLPTLGSCLSTCRRLNHAIKSSALINYSIQLQGMGLMDNPAVSYDEISLDERLKLLGEYKKRRIIWKTSADVYPFLSLTTSIKGEAGVLYEAPRSGLDVQLLRWTNLPSNVDQAIEGNIFHLSNPPAIIEAHAVSIEENDLFSFATWHWNDGLDSLPIQIHLVQHSTKLPYPGLVSPVLDICAFHRRYPVVNLAIRGTNMAVMVGHHGSFDRDESTWAGHLSVWNWKTGEKKCEKLNVADMDTDLVFLREDILLHGCSMNRTLDVYHIPMSTPSVGGGELRLVEQLGLPRVKSELERHRQFSFRISFIDNPTAVPSFTETSNPKVTRLFTADNLSSILAVVIKMRIEDDGWKSCLLITHHGTLLDRADRVLLSRQDATPRSVSWEKWGPEVTRMFWDKDFDSDASCGSRLFRWKGNFIAVYDFGPAGRRINGLQDSQRPSHNSLSLGRLDDDPECQDGYFQDVVHTKLPFVYQNFGIDGVDMREWDTMYVDQSRIVGIRYNGIDVLYIG